MAENTNYNQPDLFNDEDDSSFDIMEWVNLLLHQWYLLALGLVIGVSLAYYQNRSWKPRFVSEMKLMIEDNSANQYSFMQGFSAKGGYRNANNELLLLHSYGMMRQTASALPFDVEYYTRGRFKVNSLYGREPVRIEYDYLSPLAYNYEFSCEVINDSDFVISTVVNEKNVEIKGRFGVPFEHSLMFATVYRTENTTPSNYQFKFCFRSIESLEEEFFARTLVSWADDMSSVVSVSLVGENPQRDADFLDKLAEEYIKNNLAKKNAEAVRTIDFINEQLEQIARDLATSEGKLRAYRRNNNIIDVNNYVGTVLSKQAALAEQRIQLEQKERYFKYLSDYLTDNIGEDVLVAPTSIGVSDPTLLDLVSQYNKLQLDRSEIGEKNPNYTRYTKQMEQVRDMLLEVLRNVRSVYDLDRANYEAEYQRTLEETRGLPDKEVAMINMERDYKINDSYYTYLLQKRSEAQIRKASNVADNSVLQKARIGGVVNASVKRKTYTMYALIGLLLPALLIILRELLNFTIRSEKDLTKVTGGAYTLIGNIRHTKAVPDHAVLATLSPKSAFAESLRGIRTRLESIAQRKTPIAVMITSAESGDGKTYFAINLAGIYSLVSRKTLLIDLDLRKPSVAPLLHMHHKGLTHYLIGDITLDEMIVKDDNLGFDVILGGNVPPNPGELIRSEKMNDLFAELKKRYDYIIVDTSPLGLVTDAFPIAHQVDVNLLVVRCAKTNKSVFKNFVEHLRIDKIPNAYCVLNDVDEHKMGKSGYGNYNYGYGYGYYGHNKKAKKHADSYYIKADFEAEE